MVRFHRIIVVFLVLPVEPREVEEIPCFNFFRLLFQAQIRQVTIDFRAFREHTFEGWWTSGGNGRPLESLVSLSITIKKCCLPFASHEDPSATGFWRHCYSWRGRCQWDHADERCAPSLSASDDSTGTRVSNCLGWHWSRTLLLILLVSYQHSKSGSNFYPSVSLHQIYQHRTLIFWKCECPYRDHIVPPGLTGLSSSVTPCCESRPSGPSWSRQGAPLDAAWSAWPSFRSCWDSCPPRFPGTSPWWLGASCGMTFTHHLPGWELGLILQIWSLAWPRSRGRTYFRWLATLGPLFT